MSNLTEEYDAQIRSASRELRDGGQLLEPARRFTLSNLEARGEDGSDEWEFVGHAAVFDDLSEELGVFFPFLERIQRGAFKKVLGDDVRFLLNHEGMPLARTRAGTLRLKEDPKGLAVEADIAPITAGRDLRVSLERGDVDQMSIMFIVGDYEWDETGEIPVRVISRIEQLFDVSVVTFPAYPTTDAGVRAAGGLSRDELLARAWAIHRGEAEATPEERSALDKQLETFSIVSPWIAERTLRAVAEEPELLAAIPGQRAHVELKPDAAEPAFRLAAAQRRLKAREHLVRD